MIAPITGYEILEPLSAGGMGAVLLARRRGPAGFERLVAIKTIRPELAGAAPARAMFLDEARLLARLGHPAIAQVHDFGEHAGGLYLVMEYVAGIALRDLAHRPLPPAVAARTIAEAARGIHAAHELHDLRGHLLGVVHRDLSPENLMIGFDGHIKVLDFGIALVKGRQAPVTELGTVKGKPPYMAPEQVKNEPVDRRADVWALGVVLHELLTGEPVFAGESIYAVARAVEHQVLVAPSARAGPLPPGLDAAVMRCLERDLERRTPTAAALATELEEVAAAAGGESLAAWAERHLAADRERHRAWLTALLARAGDDTLRPGRASGISTAVAAPAADETAAPTPRPSPTPAPELPAASPRARALALAALVAVALVIGAAVLMLLRHDEVARISDDAALDATVAALLDATAIDVDGAIDDDAIDDALPIDAPRSYRDAGPRRRSDAGSAAIVRDTDQLPPDAATTTPAGTGLLTIGAEPYANVILDGANIGSTPIIRKKLPAGHHEIILVSPDSGAVRLQRPIDVAPGQHVQIRAP